MNYIYCCVHLYKSHYGDFSSFTKGSNIFTVRGNGDFSIDINSMNFIVPQHELPSDIKHKNKFDGDMQIQLPLLIVKGKFQSSILCAKNPTKCQLYCRKKKRQD